MTGHQKDNLVVLTALHEIITPPYPATTLDNFCFMVGGHLAAWPAVFCPSGWIVLVIPHLLGKVELHCRRIKAKQSASDEETDDEGASVGDDVLVEQGGRDEAGEEGGEQVKLGLCIAKTSQILSLIRKTKRREQHHF